MFITDRRSGLTTLWISHTHTQCNQKNTFPSPCKSTPCTLCYQPPQSITDSPAEARAVVMPRAKTWADTDHCQPADNVSREMSIMGCRSSTSGWGTLAVWRHQEQGTRLKGASPKTQIAAWFLLLHVLDTAGFIQGHQCYIESRNTGAGFNWLLLITATEAEQTASKKQGSALCKRLHSHTSLKLQFDPGRAAG